MGCCWLDFYFLQLKALFDGSWGFLWRQGSSSGRSKTSNEFSVPLMVENESKDNYTLKLVPLKLKLIISLGIYSSRERLQFLMINVVIKRHCLSFNGSLSQWKQLKATCLYTLSSVCKVHYLTTSESLKPSMVVNVGLDQDTKFII